MTGEFFHIMYFINKLKKKNNILCEYIMFKTKYNSYIDKHALTAWLIVLHMTSILVVFFQINKYQLLYCIFEYAHAGTQFTLVRN